MSAGSVVGFGWGPEGIDDLDAEVATVAIVDVLRFTTCVSVACARGATVLPYEWHDDSVHEFARLRNAVVAGNRGNASAPWSLSPTDLQRIPTGTRLVLPSPNGSALSRRAAARGFDVSAASLRNASAVGAMLARSVAAGGLVAVIAAGERWRSNGALRPALEDLLGAGAVLAAVARHTGTEALDPDAHAARAAFLDAGPELAARLRACASGVELIERRWSDDVDCASQLDADDIVPVLRGGEYRAPPH